MDERPEAEKQNMHKGLSQKAYNPQQPMLSIHLPKCAGASFKRTLEDWFPGKLFFHYFDEKTGQPPVRHQLGAGSCIHGHFTRKRGIGVEDYYPDIDQRITVVRDPLEVAMSNYFYIKRQSKGAGFYRDGVKQQEAPPSLDAFLEGRDSYFFDFLPREIDDENYRDVLDKYFLFIGVVERMGETMNGLSALLKKPEAEIPHVNMSPRDDELSKETETAFRERNALAYKIYDYANQRLDEAIAN